MKTLLTAFFLLGTAATAQTATAQTDPAALVFKLNCQDGGWTSYNGQKNACETRDLTFAVPVGQPLAVNADPNGGITVHGWDGPDVRVRAKVQAQCSSEGVAAARVHRIRVEMVKGTLRATDPDQDRDWSVSYELFVPRTTALALNTVNGGISLDHLSAAITFVTTNGGIDLADLGGQVKGETTNGGVTIALGGSRWEGQGLDVTTTNGGIHWTLPRSYSAQLYTSTDMGGIRTSLPVIKSGLFHKAVEASLGQGGAPVKAVTTNGGISVDQGRD